MTIETAGSATMLTNLKSYGRRYFFCVDSLTFHIYTVSHRVVLERILKLAVPVVESSSEAFKTKV